MANIRQDITGMRSGRLTAIERTDIKRKGCTLWRCSCDCGNEILLEPYKIKRQITQSCGCSRRGRRMKDLTGQRFGRLVAVERLDRKRGNSYLWRCKCDCGSETEAAVNALISGNTTSCGCAKIDALRERAIDISGKKYGYLTPLRPLDERAQGSVVWECRCDCGKICRVPYNSIVRGNTASCGCKKNEHEQPPLHYVDGTCIEMLKPKGLRANNTSGCTGVVALPNGRWRAQIVFKGRRHVLGTYSDYNMAVEARKKGEARIFGEFLDAYYTEQTPTNISQMTG